MRVRPDQSRQVAFGEHKQTQKEEISSVGGNIATWMTSGFESNMFDVWNHKKEKSLFFQVNFFFFKYKDWNLQIQIFYLSFEGNNHADA